MKEREVGIKICIYERLNAWTFNKQAKPKSATSLTVQVSILTRDRQN